MAQVRLVLPRESDGPELFPISFFMSGFCCIDRCFFLCFGVARDVSVYTSLGLRADRVFLFGKRKGSETNYMSLPERGRMGPQPELLS